MAGEQVIKGVLQRLLNTRGADAARRLERAADEVPNLGQLYQQRALERAFSDEGYGALTVIPPGRFEDYARPLTDPKAFTHTVEHPTDDWVELGYDDYMKYLGDLRDKGGFSDVPFLELGERAGGAARISGHEGRHRMRAMQEMGDKAGLVRVLPRGDVREAIKNRDQQTYIANMQRFLDERGRMVEPERTMDGTPRPMTDFPEPFAAGGVAKKATGALSELFRGKPSTVKIPTVGEIPADPIPAIQDAAESYMRKRGSAPGEHFIVEYPEYDKELAQRIAKAYEEMPHAPRDPAVRRSYDALIDETLDQYRALKDSGIDFKFLKDGQSDPYARSPSLGYHDIQQNGRLWVFPTDQGYGTLSDIGDNPLLKRVGRVGDLENATANDAFRIVHDAYGHFGPGNPFFRAPGEDRAWLNHSRMFSPEARGAMTSETRGQNSWLNEGPHAEHNKTALGADTIYADQKAGLMPSWTMRPGALKTAADLVGEDRQRAFDFLKGLRRGYADGGLTDADKASMTHSQSYGSDEFEKKPLQVPFMGKTYTVPYTNFPKGTVEGVKEVGDFVLPQSWGDAALSAMGPAAKLGGKAAMKATGAAAGFLYGAEPDDAQAMFIGQRAKGFLTREAERAKRMLSEGLDPKQTWQATRYMEDPFTGHMKTEIGDELAGVDQNIHGRLLDKDTKLGRILGADELYNEYPDLRDVRVFNDKTLGGARGAFYPQKGEIGVLAAQSDEDMRRTLLHEAQHWIQKKEGWLSGSNMLNHGWVSDLMDDRRVYEAAQEYQNWLAQTRLNNDLNAFFEWKKTLPSGTDTSGVFGNAMQHTPDELHAKIMSATERLGPVKDTYDAYRRHPGEVEAHNVEVRRDFDPITRRNRAPWETQYVQDGFYTRNPGETFDNLKQYVRKLKP